MRVGSILVVLGIYVATIGLSIIFVAGEIRVGSAFVFVGGNMIYVGKVVRR